MSRMIAPFCIVLIFFLTCAAAQTTPSMSGADTLPDGPGKEVVQRQCLSCHNVRIATNKRGNEDDWADTVSKMIGRGANISDDDAETIVEYMAAHYGPSAPKQEVAAPAKAGDSSTSQPSSSSLSTGDAPADKTEPPANIPINVNKAVIDELESSLDLSKGEAEAIVRYRQQNGEFKTMQQLLSVPGVDVNKIKKDEKKIRF